jgi:hypothetical protein
VYQRPRQLRFSSHQAHIERCLSAVAGDLQHVVDARDLPRRCAVVWRAIDKRLDEGFELIAATRGRQ